MTDTGASFAGRSTAARFVLALLFGVLLCAGSTTHASAGSIAYKGIALTPAIVNLNLQKGQTRAHVTINVTNNTRNNQVLAVSTIDFRSLGETGGLAFIGSSASQIAYKYGLGSWLNVGSGAVELAPGQTKAVPITIENRSDLSPGGHYAAILFKPENADPGGGTTPVAINEVVSSLLFVSKVDGAHYAANLASTSIPSSWLRPPGAANVVFENTGDIQTTPRGLITVTGPFSHEISRGVINTDANLLLPDSSRLYLVNLFKTGHAWWPGIYHVNIMYHFDGSPTLQTARTSFLYVSPVVTGMILAAAAAGWYLTRTLLQRRRNRRKHRRTQIHVQGA